MNIEHMPRLGRVVRIIARERDEGVVRVFRINRDPAHEASRRRRSVDAEKDNLTACLIGVRRDENASAPQSRPKRAVVARRPLRCDDILTGRFVLPKGSAGKVLPDSLPVSAGTSEDQVALGKAARKKWELGTVRLEKSLVTAVVLRPPNVLRAQEPCAAYARVGDQWDVEGHVLAAQTGWVPDPVPTFLTKGCLGSASKVHVDLREPWSAKVRVHPDVWIADINAGLTAVAEYSYEPAAGVESVRAVVLRPAHDVIERVVHVDRQALERKRPQSVVQRRDRRRDL